jgi:hypothetical protein
MPRNLLLVPVGILITLGIMTEALAFDNARKGFIMGFGLGCGVTSFDWTVNYAGRSTTSNLEHKGVFFTDFKIGHAPTDLLQIYGVSKLSWFEMKNESNNYVIVLSGMLGGAGATYSLHPQAPSPFISGGLGLSIWNTPFEEFTDNWYGLGLFGGAGYEFSRHWSVEGGVCWGQPSHDESGAESNYDVLSFRLTVNFLEY